MLVKLVHAEIELRRQAGQRASVDEYAARFPQLDRPTLHDLITLPAAPPTKLAPEPLVPKRFQLIEEVGRGGIGCVWRVHDTRMERPLAIKMLLPHLRADGASNRRLKRECLLTASLQHPGVPPVHGFDTMADDAVYFTMKLVEGQTLANLLANRDADDVALPKLLAIFEQVAQTLAYAHAQNVIHRDLKPHNIMVGQFGEVQVMDWGMAKRIGARADDRLQVDDPLMPPAPPATTRPRDDVETTNTSVDSSVRETSRLGGSRDTSGEGKNPSASLTHAGDILGTPAYMAPEQAQGNLEALSAASDVFGLGAILFEILTRSRLYANTQREALLAAAAQGDMNYSLAQLDSAEVDSALKALCKRCLAKAPADRPEHAGEVASATTGHLANVQDRLRQTELNRRAAEVRFVEERKRRKTALLMTGVIAGVIVCGLLGVVWQWRSAVAARDLAEQRFEQATAAVNDYLFEVSESRELLRSTPGTQALRRRLLEKGNEYYTKFLADAPNDPRVIRDSANMQLQLAQLTASISSPERSLEHYHTAEALFERLIREGHDTAANRDQLLVTTQRIGSMLREMGRLEEAIDVRRKQIERCEAFLDDSPHDPSVRLSLANAYHNLAVDLHSMNQVEKAANSYKQSLALKEALIEVNPHDHELLQHYATTLQQIGVINHEDANYAEALQQFQEGLAIYQRLEANGVTGLEELKCVSHQYIAAAHNSLGDPHAAVDVLRASVKAMEATNQANPLVRSHAARLGEVYGQLAKSLLAHPDRSPNRGEELLQVTTKAIELLEPWVSKNPDSLQMVFHLGTVRDLRGGYFGEINKLEDAAVELQAAVKHRRTAYQLLPSYWLNSTQLLSSYASLSDVQARLGRNDVARLAYQQGLDFIKSLESHGDSDEESLKAAKAQFIVGRTWWRW